MEEQLNSLTVNANILWVLLAAFLVFFMQAGFALVEAGFTRAKNVAHTMLMNLMVFCIGAIGFWICGFAFAFGGVNHTYPATGANAEWNFGPVTLGAWGDALSSNLAFGDQWGVLGTSGFFLNGIGLSAAGIFAFFMFQMVFMDTAATIPTGSGAERIKFIGFVIMGFLVSMFVYPLSANWVWGGGWMANMGRTLGLGNGAVDFAGSGVVHMTGGAVGLAIALVLGPRIGKFNKDGSANTILGHNLPMGVLGAIILFFGWFGFNPGSSLGIQGSFMNLTALAALNTLIAGAAGGISAMTYTWLKNKKPDPGMSVNGLLAGLVAVTAPCAFITPVAAAIIGAVGGVLVIFASILLEKLKIDDPVGAVPVHLFNGFWGVIAVGLFANGNPDTASWNGIDGQAVTGLFYGGGAGQLFAQLIEGLGIGITAFVLSFVLFKALAKLGLMRSRAEDEVAGLDLPEMGMPGYVSDGAYMPETGAAPAPSEEPVAAGLPAGAAA